MTDLEKICSKTAQTIRKNTGIRKATAQARARWSRENSAKIQCCLSLEETAKVEAICRRFGVTKYRLTKALILAIIDQMEDELPSASPIEDELWMIQDHACEIMDVAATMIAAIQERRQDDQSSIQMS